MKRSEKFRQANREAQATVVATATVIIFWCIAGFGLADIDIYFFHTPLWVWTGCVGTWIFAILVSLYLSEKVFMNFNLDDDEEENRND
ncbi:MAG: YhdT family protein [Acidaminococcaceae bacterium]|nr:YhdT family protein [Acidaminococcaceae bacterium]